MYNTRVVSLKGKSGHFGGKQCRVGKTVAKDSRDGRARFDLQEQLPTTDRSRPLDRQGGIQRKSRNTVS
jgi:hypothetical protein